MPIEPDLLEILICPETKQALRVATAQELAGLNARIASGELRTRGGEPLPKPIQEGLVREDGKVLYQVDDGIPVMLIEESVPL
jgi:uncharacterized protein YbaR (Trm112 family)